jgi:hypothetical protein
MACSEPVPALSLFPRCLQLAQIYQLALEDLPAASQPEVVLVVQQLLSRGGTAASGVALLTQFPPLQQHFDVPGILEELVAGSQLTTAARWAETLGRELQASFSSLLHLPLSFRLQLPL